MNLTTLQTEVAEWAGRNFPNAQPHQPLLGISEEAGELCEAQLLSLSDLEGETWRELVGNNRYAVSNLGRVKRIAAGKGAKPGLMRVTLSNGKRNKGYGCVRIYSGRKGSGKCMTIHGLVMAAFVGPRPKGFEVNHKNGRKADNRLSNLEYVTHAGNMRHSVSIGLHDRTRRIKEANSQVFREIQMAIGKLCHAHLKMEQGIRGTHAEHQAAKRDAIGDLFIFAAHYCVLNNIDLASAVQETWDIVNRRDWQKNKESGTA